MKMKNLILTAIAALSVLCGCAKSTQPGLNDNDKRYLDAWIAQNHPELADKKIFPGFYIMNDVPGEGELIGDAANSPYFRANYRVTDLNGNITSSTYESDAYKLRVHNNVNYYGPFVFERADNALYAGLDYAITDMKVGGTREVLVPGWLLTNERFGSEEEYLNSVSGTTAIYSLEITERIPDIRTWEMDSLNRFMTRNYPSAVMDSAGFFRKTLKEPAGSFSNDTTFYINYIGRRLDGVVFDTNIADTAKVHGLYSAFSSYSPVLINWKKKYDEITMTSDKTEVIPGFSYLLSKMGPYEKAIGMFISSYGYSSTGSGLAIPAYSPLMFEVEVVDNE